MTDVGELSRVYQATLEARRRLYAHVGDTCSFTDELESADKDVDRAYAEVLKAWVG